MAIKEKGSLNNIISLLMQTGIGIIIFLIIWLVVINLPMLKEIDFPLDFTLAELISVILLFLITVMLVNFGNHMELNMVNFLPRFPQAGNLIKLFVFVISTFILYAALRPLVQPYLNDFAWVYHLIFLILIATLLSILGFNIYVNVDKIAPLVLSQKGNATLTSAVVCNKCGNEHCSDDKLCSSCGAELPKCDSCGVLLKPEAKFCFSCGSEVRQDTAETTAADGPLPAASTCSSCGAALREAASYCFSCGAAQQKT